MLIMTYREKEATDTKRGPEQHYSRTNKSQSSINLKYIAVHRRPHTHNEEFSSPNVVRVKVEKPSFSCIC